METEDAAGAAPRRPIVEWIVGALSAAIVVGLAAYLAYEAMFADSHPPDLHVAIEDMEASDTGTRLTVAVTNEGDRTASKVTVRAFLQSGNGPDTDREIEFDYVAGHSVRTGAIVLPRQASASDLRVEIGGYVEP